MTDEISIYDQILRDLDAGILDVPVGGDDDEAGDKTAAAITAALIEEVTKIRPVKKQVPKPPPLPQPTPTYNLIDEETLESFCTPKVTHLDGFSPLFHNTITLNGKLKNIFFHEEELIGKLSAVNNVVVCIDCNYGTHKNELYVPKRVIIHKKKVKRPRKKQGSGKCFNSQITFYVRVQEADGIHKQYGFKVFRTGKLQLPGARLETIRGIINSVTPIIHILNGALYPNEADIDKMVSLEYITPSMKNYKFIIEMNPMCILNLAILKKLLLDKKKNREEDAKWPLIHDVCYSGEDTKLYIGFQTPTEDLPYKIMRVNIFSSGRVNILGGLEDVSARRVYKLLHSIFAEHRDQLIIIPVEDMEMDSEYVLLD